MKSVHVIYEIVKSDLEKRALGKKYLYPNVCKPKKSKNFNKIYLGSRCSLFICENTK